LNEILTPLVCERVWGSSTDRQTDRQTARSLQVDGFYNTLTPELNPSAQRCLAKLFTEDFAS
jgi:hypothetical protein